jgi:hypothetical protein
MLHFLSLFPLMFSAAFADINDDKIAFVSSFVESQNKPTTLIVWQNCFNSNQKLNLVKSVFTYTLFTTQVSLNESDFNVNPQNNLFVVDLTCTNTPEKIIEKVNPMILSFSLLVCDSISISSSPRSTLCCSRIPIDG